MCVIPGAADSRSSEPYDPYIPAGSSGAGPSSGGGPPQNQKVSPTPTPAPAPRAHLDTLTPKIADIQAQIDSTVDIMHQNITKVAERGERLDTLQDKTGE